MSEQLLEELKVLRIASGEMLVIQADGLLSENQRQKIMDALNASGVRAVVLDGGLKAVAVQSASSARAE